MKNLNLISKDKIHIENIYPLSPMQSGLLFQSLYAPDSDAYFVQSVFEIEGEVAVAVLRQAWQKVGDQHPILRTGFVWEKIETPLQYILVSAEVPFDEYVWEEKDTENIQIKLERFIQEDRNKGFDLSKAPLLRVSLIEYAQDKYYMIWSQHHILIDGWSLPIIFRDLFQAYRDIKEGKKPLLQTPRSYQDYIRWVQAQDLNKAEIFWKENLSAVEPTRLSFKDMIQETQEKDYERASCVLSLDETEKIKTFAREQGITLNTVVQGAVGIVLQTYTQQKDVVMGVTVSGRNIDLSGIEEMVGLFINTLPLKITYLSEETVLSFLNRLQEQTQKLNDYAYTPLAHIQSWVKAEKGLFDVIFVFENYPLEENTQRGDSDYVIKGVKGIEKTEYPLTIAAGPGKQLHLSLSYQTEHFSKEIIQKLSEHIRQVLKGMVERELSSSLQDITLLTPQEKHQLLIEWNDTQASYEEKRIHELFEEQVAKNPHNIALVYEDQSLTYQHLNDKANQLAHHLQSLGVGPDVLVAIAVERSLEMVVGLLSILKAGGAYVPLDPDYPEERLQFMLEDTRASVLMTQSWLKPLFQGYKGCVVTLDEDQPTFMECPKTNLSVCIAPHHLAYVIYTSGSTGRPKGVMVGHESLTDYIKYAQKTYPLSKGSSILNYSTAFDASILSIFSPFIFGFSIFVPLKGFEMIIQKISLKNKMIFH